MKSIIKWLSASVIVIMMGGCDLESTIASLYVHGGTAAAPATLSLDVGNVIEKNSFYNYFQYTAKEDEKLDIHAVLEFAITSSTRMDCEQSGDTFIVVYDNDMNQLDGFRTCTTDLTVEFPADGRYVLQVKYPGNDGYFDADSTMP